MSTNSLDEVIRSRRSLRGALADLRHGYRQRPTAQLARMIQQLEAEISIRRPPVKLPESVTKQQRDADESALER